ncbi:MAG: methyltransferase, partial [Sphingobacteriales bacterium]|nr:methyltransferase [Sphingobacteriales bacterium]
MANSYFQFRQFTIYQDQCAMKVTTDGCLFGAWVARELHEENKESQQYLDIGAGTGLLPLMIIQQNPECRFDAIEIDAPAYKQALSNITAAGRGGSVQLVHGDIHSFNPGKKYDCIISNPPFYEKELKGDNTRKNIAHHNEGLLLPDLLKRCGELLKEEGTFYLLLPY